LNRLATGFQQEVTNFGNCPDRCPIQEITGSR
jgi:hypothetical protein